MKRSHLKVKVKSKVFHDFQPGFSIGILAYRRRAVGNQLAAAVRGREEGGEGRGRVNRVKES